MESQTWTLALAAAAVLLALTLFVTLARERLPLLEILEAEARKARNPNH
jgi:hypothetical protein